MIHYLINTDVINLNSTIIHSDSNDIVVLRMESKKSCSRRRWHKSSHRLAHYQSQEQSVSESKCITQNIKHMCFHITLNVIMLNKEIFPPEADITYESFLDKAKQGTASSGLFSAASLVIRIPLAGCHC